MTQPEIQPERYSIRNWQDAVAFIGKPGKFSDDPDMNYNGGILCDEGILTEVSVCFDAEGGTAYFYAEDENHNPLGSYYYFQPVKPVEEKQG